MDNYYNLIRYDILKLLPESAVKILDVGCGAGATGAEIKRRMPHSSVTGIELNDVAAAIAASRLDRVISCDLDNAEFDFETASFDCIIAADVLEHTKNPENTLNYLKTFLKENGWLLISLPNIRYIVPVIKILRNKFEYEESGVLDRTHLRFFTLHTMEKFLHDCGFEIVKRASNRNKGWKMKLLSVLSFGLLSSFSVYQYIFLARKL